MITGFQAQVTVDDAGTGAALGGAATKFDGLITFNLPSLEAGTFDATELNQVDGGSAADPYEREQPTGLIKMGKTKCEAKFSKANYQRLQSLLQRGRGYTWVLTSPDDQTSGSPVKLTTTFTGFVNKLDDVKFERGNPVTIPFEVTVQSKPTYS